jgi:hypothetical protein
MSFAIHGERFITIKEVTIMTIATAPRAKRAPVKPAPKTFNWELLYNGELVAASDFSSVLFDYQKKSKHPERYEVKRAVR